MRSTLTRLATPSKFLTPGNPTGLTGFLTHPSPRAELVGLYSVTLAKLAKLPAHSSYRNATEALTKHRLAQVESVKPAGWDEWKTKADELLQKYPAMFSVTHARKRFKRFEADGKAWISEQIVQDIDEEELEYGGQYVLRSRGGAEGQASAAKLAARTAELAKQEVGEENWVAEPRLDADQVSQLEEKIGAGLLEEVIAVAEAECELVDTMLENQVWEELVEKPAPGQWSYFQRDRNVGETQEPPKVG